MSTDKNYDLVCEHQYHQVRLELERDYSNDEEGSFQHGDITTYGIALLGDGKLREGIDHFVNIVIPKRRNKVSKHELLVGIGHWYLGERDKAIGFWTKALKSGYASDKVYSDVYAMLFFAATLAPELLQLEELIRNFASKRRANPHPLNYEYKIIAYYLGEIDDAGLMGYSMLCGVGYNADGKKYYGGELINQTKAYYHIALSKYRANDQRGYIDNMKLGSDIRALHFRVESFVTYLEAQHLEGHVPGSNLIGS